MIDANCLLGAYPFRRLPFETADALLRKMDQIGIERAAVSRLEAVFYKDVQVANEELFRIVEGHVDRFWPIAVINPTLPSWEEDFTECQKLGMRGVRLHPNYHGYSPASLEAVRLVEKTAALGLPVVISMGIEDTRHHHRQFLVPDVSPGETAQLINYLPNATYLIAGATCSVCLAIEGLLEDPTNVHYDLSRVQGPVGDVALLVGRMGAGRILFGSNLPLHVPESAQLSIDTADISEPEKDLIRQGNARRLLGET